MQRASSAGVWPFRHIRSLRNGEKASRLCDSKGTRQASSVRGPLKKSLLLFWVSIFLFQARTSQLAFIVLNTANWGAGRLPSDWQVKVNHGKPEISICREGESC